MRLPFVITRFPSQSTGRPRRLIISQNKAVNSEKQRKNMTAKKHANQDPHNGVQWSAYSAFLRRGCIVTSTLMKQENDWHYL